MTRTLRIAGLALGAALLGAGLTAGLHASQGNTAGGPPPFSGRQFGGQRPGGPHIGPFAPLRQLVSRLNLTDAQKTQLKSALEAHRDEWRTLARQAADARSALHDAVTAEAIDEAVIRQRAAEAAAVEADVAVARAHARAELFKLLTPEQQAQAKAMQAEMKNRAETMRKRFEDRGGR